MVHWGGMGILGTVSCKRVWCWRGPTDGIGLSKGCLLSLVFLFLFGLVSLGQDWVIDCAAICTFGWGGYSTFLGKYDFFPGVHGICRFIWFDIDFPREIGALW